MELFSRHHFNNIVHMATYFIVCRNFCLLLISAGILDKMALRSTKKLNTILN